jgi:hypothetical protein
MQYEVVTASTQNNISNTYKNTNTRDSTSERTRKQFETLLNTKISEGWQPYGGVSMSIDRGGNMVFAQAIVMG